MSPIFRGKHNPKKAKFAVFIEETLLLGKVGDTMKEYFRENKVYFSSNLEEKTKFSVFVLSPYSILFSTGKMNKVKEDKAKIVALSNPTDSNLSRVKNEKLSDHNFEILFSSPVLTIEHKKILDQIREQVTAATN
jgi:hypothetical protein